MIIIRYLILESIKSQLAILFVLIIIFSCQKFIRILWEVVEGDLPLYLVGCLLGLSISEFLKFFLPLSLLLALLITLSRLYVDNEIIIIYSCGIGKKIIFLAVIILVLMNAMMTTINVMWFAPFSSHYYHNLLWKVKSHTNLSKLMEGHFQKIGNTRSVLFINKVQGKKMQNIFFAQFDSKLGYYPFIVLAKEGEIQNESQSQQKSIILKTGIQYAILPQNLTVTHFGEYQGLLNNPMTYSFNIRYEMIPSLGELWHSNQKKFREELHWRLTLILSVLIMALISIPLSTTVKCRNRFCIYPIAILLYLTFFLFQTLLRYNSMKIESDSVLLMMWMINVVYLFFAIVLNFRDSIISRKIYWWVYNKFRGRC
ncbi:LPS export ABC transporter permease LptF [Candidatus Schneideria nysicola]|uniref:LPS export ABC transporter permease LptF n=1 Tax=Candidatus Schneideria nysicola TaxID=1081631 RepID=UPI001CAA4343|nr:LPS export ABC transporter permease LptF [Candidatus Schneideria nysicola]UAJ65841.1 LPS export ABC transporter permease LptF [Candidatus Schneideria nysicola]